MRNLVYCAVLFLGFCVPSFAATHFIGRTLEPTGKLVLFPVKKSVYPVRHPVKTSKGLAKGVSATVKAIF